MKDIIKSAFDLLANGNKLAALDLFLRSLNDSPNDFDALHMAGVIYAEHGDVERGLKFLEAAMKVGENIYIHNNYGNILLAAGKPDAAEQAFRRAIELDESYAEAWSNLGNLFLQRNDYELALSYYSRAIAIRPNFADALANRGVANHALGEHRAAIADFEAALNLHANSPFYYLAYAELKMDMGELNIARLLINRSLEMAPNNGLSLAALGRLEGVQGRYKNAIEILEKAIALLPGHVAAYRHCALAYSHLGYKRKAAELMEKACELNPYDPNLYWELCFIEIPTTVFSIVEAQEARSKLFQRLSALASRKDINKIKIDCVGNVGPFYLMYHGINDLDIYKEYGRLCHDVMGRKFSPNIKSAPRDGRVRICLVSAAIFKHSVWVSNIEGFYKKINLNKFDIYTIDLSGKIGAEQSFAKSKSAYFKDMSRASLGEIVSEIEGINPDILYYPEIGLNATIIRLANLRLCENQVTTWGNPETLGFPNIDYFLSVKEFERVGAQRFYSEKLRLLPLAESYYASRSLEDRPEAVLDLGVDLSKKIILCLGSSFKIQYNFFKIFKEIWGLCDGVQFIFSDNGNAVATLVKESISEIASVTGNNNSVLFVPWLEDSVFYSLMRRSFLMLEGMNFSGYNMAIQALECGLPIVCRQGEMLRENFAAGLLEEIGAGEFVAPNIESVPALVRRLLSDVAYYNKYKKIVTSEVVKNKLFDRPDPMLELEAFLQDISRTVDINSN